MADSARIGLSQFAPSRTNTAVNNVTGCGGGGGGPTTAIIDPVTGKPRRLSGSKRDLEAAQTSDTAETAALTASAAAASGQPPAKKKITYQLPHQNMEPGHFYIVLGEDIDVSTGRFKILSLLGEGTFGKVVEAWDRKRKEYCAVKIVRNIPKYTKDATYEINFMDRVRRADPDDVFPLMKIQRHFQNETGHMCIVMNKYGPCLLDWLMKNGPLNHRALAEVIFQTGAALDFFHTEMRLIHTDLKPENMLLESTAPPTKDPISGRSVPALPCKIRLCDLGGCCDERHSKNAIVSTRHYRSPEVILGLGWMFSTDMWSMGCIIYELFTGRLLYDTHDNLEHLHLMERTLGKLPSEWAARATGEGAACVQQQHRSATSSSSSSNTCGYLLPCTDPKHIARVARARPVEELIPDEDLRDLVLGLLRYDRSRRYTARRMATHPYVQRYFPEAVNSSMHPFNRTLKSEPDM